jgi:N-acylneuraminate cytidylyltransferase/CMP-N,N'-diacetyllegionaminic acid synthase
VRRICTVCARGGSKSVPNKNIRALGGRPLVAHTLEQARASGLFELIAVSSDSQEILDLSLAHGADLGIERPPGLATDAAPKVPAIRHCVEKAEHSKGHRFDVVVDLDATSPLRLTADIRGAVALLENGRASNVITAAPARRSPYFNLVEVGDNGIVRLSKPPAADVVRRQDSPPCFDMNASIYVWRRDALFDDPAIFTSSTLLFVMPEERSLDIDSELDFELVEMLLNKRTAQ